jgi:hypothetical protein
VQTSGLWHSASDIIIGFFKQQIANQISLKKIKGNYWGMMTYTA